MKPEWVFLRPGSDMSKLTGQDGSASMTAEEILLVYESLLAATQAMLAQARESEWTALLEGESRYVVEVEALARREATVSFDESQTNRKAELLEGILENDLEIRRLLLVRRDELGEIIGVNQRKRDLNRAYHPGGTTLSKPGRITDDT